MKKLIGVLVSVSLIIPAWVPAFAAPEATTDAAAEEDTAAALAVGMETVAAEEDVIQYTDLSLALSYDDRYDLSELQGISSGTDYVIYQTEYADGQGITSYRVSEGTNTGEADEALLTLDDGTEAIATGVGSGTVWLVRADQEDALRKALEEGDGSDNNNSQETIDVYKIAVTVEPATLTVMLLAGQSNMEGYCSTNADAGYDKGASIASEEGVVYSTYAPWSSDIGPDITGISFSEYCTLSNYSSKAGDFVAGSLQGDVTNGTKSDPANMSGGTLEYPLNSLTKAGGGKTGPDSGLAYEWSQRTGDKVWVVNAAYGATAISRWLPSSGDCYARMTGIWKNVEQTYEAEIAAGHYSAGEKLVFWLQGESDRSRDAVDYESDFAKLYDGLETQVDPDGIGIIMVRASTGTNRDADDLEMNGPRIAQYWLGSGNSSYDNVFVVTNANEQWVTDSGVKTYFQNRYGSALSYPTHSGKTTLPTTVNAVHYDIHYSQIGHNENGITAADGMVEALSGSSAPSSVSWRDGSGQTVSSLTLELVTDTAIAVPVAEPVYTAKQLTWESMSGSVISYDAASGIVKATSELSIGTENLVATAGGKTATLPVTVSTPLDLSGVAGSNYTGLYKYNGIWWYLKNGIVQPDYEGLAENEYGLWYVKNGRVDYTYTGFAENSSGKWYMEDGKATLEKNGVIKDTTGAIGTEGNWYYVVGSKVQTGFTGLADYKNENGWWYIQNGVVDFSANTVAKNKNGWFYVTGGKVDFSYNGFGENKNGKWYCEGGQVTFNKNGVLKDTTGAIGTKGTWYYVVGSQVQTGFTGLANYRNENGWWYIRRGEVDFSACTVAKNNNGWFYVTGGKVDFSYNGFGENNYGKWYVDNGQVTFGTNSVLKDDTGAIGTKGTWYYVVGSQVQTGFTGLANYRNAYGWWYISDGKVDFSYNGIAQNGNGWFYLEGGKVDFSYNGRVTVRGVTYSITGGVVARWR